MKINEFLFTQAARRIQPRPNLYVPDLVRAVQDRYGFVNVPTTAAEMVPSQANEPLRFHHGKFVYGGREIFIRSLDLYSHVIAVQTGPSTTDEADVVLDDIVKAGAAHLADVSPQRLYVNQLDIMLAVDFEAAAPIAASMAAMLSRMIASYDARGSTTPEFYLVALHVNVEPRRYSLPCDFRLERRAGDTPYAENRYFSQAPLRTADHVAVLEEFERQLARLGPARS